MSMLNIIDRFESDTCGILFFRKQTLLILVILFFPGIPSLAAGSFSNLLNRSDEEYPLSNTVFREDSEASRILLLSDLPASASLMQRFYDYQPEITVERLHRIDLPAKFSNDTPESRRILFTDIVNILGKPETQARYTYYSSRKGKDVLLFEELYISNKKGKQISGLVFSEDTLPKEFSYYQYVDEASFSGTVFNFIKMKI